MLEKYNRFVNELPSSFVLSFHNSSLGYFQVPVVQYIHTAVCISTEVLTSLIVYFLQCISWSAETVQNFLKILNS